MNHSLKPMLYLKEQLTFKINLLKFVGKKTLDYQPG